MSIGDISLARNDRRASVAPNFCEPTRTLMAAAQMVGDGLILITLSCLSLGFVIYTQHQEPIYIAYFPCLLLTVGATMMMVFRFARSGVYDVPDAFNLGVIFRSTVKRFMEV